MDIGKFSGRFPLKGIIIGLVCIGIIAGSVTAAARMAASKKPPARKEKITGKMAVATVPAVEQDIALTVTGYGQADPVLQAKISPEVSGRVIEKHESLDQGGLVGKGDVLFKIDSVDYETSAEKAKIQVVLKKNEIAQLKVSFSRDQGRLEAIQQNTRLAKSEFLRLKTLYEKDRVGTLSSVETAEQSYNTLLDTEKNLEKSLDLYPLQISEAQNSLADARSDLKTAQLNVKRCIVKAPFSGRVKEADIETGTYITVGTTALTLADDTILEIQVPLSDKDAFEGLGLRRTPGQSARFSGLDQIQCRVQSVTGNVSADLQASLHRAVKYDAGSRTLYLAVRVEPYGPDLSSIPLMDGMFCKVSFQGLPVAGAVKIPASVLNSDNTIYLAREDRLKTLPVTTVMEDGDVLYVSGGFEPEDQIITTVLSSPIENASLDILRSGDLAEKQPLNTVEEI